MGDTRGGRRGRQPLPPADRGETLSCYLPRWAVERLGELADGAHLSRNMLVRRILMDYVSTAGVPRMPGQGVGLNGTEGRS